MCVSTVCPTSPLRYNKHILTYTGKQTTPIVTLSGKTHSLGSLAPVLSGPPFKMFPS